MVQLRHRGQIAERRARFVLAVLITTVLVGIIFFVGRPLVESWFDGRRGVLQAEQEVQRDTIVALNDRRREIQLALVEKLKRRADWVHRIDGGSRGLEPFALPDGGIVLLTGGGDVVRHYPSDGSWVTVFRTGGESFHHPVQLSWHGIFAFGENGSILRGDEDGNRWELIETSLPGRPSSVIQSGESANAIIALRNGTIYSFDGSSGKIELLATLEVDRLHQILPLPDKAGFLLSTGLGLLLWDDSGSEPKVINDHTPRNLFAMPNDAGFLATTSDNQILRGSANGDTWDVIDPKLGGSLQRFAVLSDGSFLLTSLNGRILKGEPDGKSWQMVYEYDIGWLNDVIIAPEFDGIFVVSDHGPRECPIFCV